MRYSVRSILVLMAIVAAFGGGYDLASRKRAAEVLEARYMTGLVKSDIVVMRRQWSDWRARYAPNSPPLPPAPPYLEP